MKENILFYSFKNLEPTREDNIVITYHQRMEDFDFKSIIEESEQYFSEINDFSKNIPDKNNLEAITFNSPFDIPNVVGNVISGVFIGVAVIIVLGIALFVFIIYRLVKRKKK